MLKTPLLPAEEREQIEELIKSFGNHGCGFGLRHLLGIIDAAERSISGGDDSSHDR